jgi:hypothetical protein
VIVLGVASVALVSLESWFGPGLGGLIVTMVCEPAGRGLTDARAGGVYRPSQ